MRVKIDPELIRVCQQIQAMDRSEEEWTECESVDMFQTDSLCGGFDACDRLFTFGRYEDGEEVYAIQISLDQVPLITRGIMRAVETMQFDDV